MLDWVLMMGCVAHAHPAARDSLPIARVARPVLGGHKDAQGGGEVQEAARFTEAVRAYPRSSTHHHHYPTRLPPTRTQPCVCSVIL